MFRKTIKAFRILRVRSALPLEVNPDNIPWVSVYREQRLVYNRIKKSGNSSILLFLNDAFFGGGAEDYKARKNESLARAVGLPDLERGELRALSGYYRFTIFRNPYARCLSAFLDKVAPGVNKWYARIPGYGVKSPEGFRTFVEFLSAGGDRANPHFWKQIDLLAFRPQDYSLIGRLENLENEFRTVFCAIGHELPPGVALGRPHASEVAAGTKVTGASSRLLEYYDVATVSKVFETYAADFELGGYDRHLPE